MTSSSCDLKALNGADLLVSTRCLVRKVAGVEAELLIHLGEIDERKLYLDCAFPSMFAFCVGELGLSEDASYIRILVARAARRLPAIVEALRSGQVHLAGLRLLVPHLSSDNHGEVLARASGKSKREIEELVARLSPPPSVPATIRKLPETVGRVPATPQTLATAAPATLPVAVPRGDRRSVIAPLSEEAFKIQFTANRGFRDKLRRAQDVLRHRVPDGDLAAILERALDLLIAQTEKERFAVGRKALHPHPATADGDASSRHIPDAIKRAVFERDGGRCTFTGEGGRRCAETGAIEFDHVDGFARTRRHAVDQIRLLCRAHNQHAALRIYGCAFMERARTPIVTFSTCPDSMKWLAPPCTS